MSRRRYTMKEWERKMVRLALANPPRRAADYLGPAAAVDVANRELEKRISESAGRYEARMVIQAMDEAERRMRERTALRKTIAKASEIQRSQSQQAAGKVGDGVITGERRRLGTP